VVHTASPELALGGGASALDDRRPASRELHPHASQGTAAPFLGSAGLGRVLADLQFTSLDIGARGGFTQDVLPLASAVDAVGFEPDAVECERLNADAATGRHPWRTLRFIPLALGRHHEVKQLHLYRRRGCSSLYEADPEVAARFGRADWFDLDATLDVPTVPTDEAAEQHRFSDACFLKVDVQGGELDILASADRLLADSMLAIRTEVEFVPIYREQPLFGDVDQHLRARGFVPMGFMELHEWNHLGRVGSHAKHDGQLDYSRGQITHGDVLYLRDHTRLPDDRPEEIVALLKLAFLAMTYGYVDHAAGILSRPAVQSHLHAAYGLPIGPCLRQVARELVRRRRQSWWLGQVRAARQFVRQPGRLVGWRS
jgi:FkbM family methyltransferase